MAIYKCPVCGKQYTETELEKLAECVKADNAAKKRVEAQNKAAEEARKAAEAKKALREKYTKTIQESRQTLEKTYDLFKAQIAAYNKMVEEAKKNAGIVASSATSTLSFGNVQVSTKLSQKFSDWLDTLEPLCKDKTFESSFVKDEDDLATIIFKSLGI